MVKVSANLNRKRRIALVDVDGILFAQACSSERGAIGDIILQTRTDEEAYQHVVSRIEELILKTESDDAILCLSDPKGNFRYDILETYKGNRVASRRPPMLANLRNLLEDRKPWPVMQVKGLEADDVCGIAQTSLGTETRETVICSPDKDLRCIPGLYYACRQDSKVEVVTLYDADRWHMFQTLVGDAVDNYCGCPKVGKVKAAQILAEVYTEAHAVNDGEFHRAEAWERIFQEFERRGHDREFALVQARVSRILRSEDWDNETKEVRLWVPPQLPASLGSKL